MPLYEYLCAVCGKRSEALQRMGDPPLTACPHCGGAVRKLFSAPSFHLKGSGWYQSDYARKSGGGEAAPKPGDGEKPASSASGESGSESKSADAAPPAKPPAKPAGD
jgi:putative FmdB family regulatory protein